MGEITSFPLLLSADFHGDSFDENGGLMARDISAPSLGRLGGVEDWPARRPPLRQRACHISA
jgi:hypothetical protein